ncbi:MAG: hypothetical protein K9N23_11210 [Akkermansiaceae bacterium]|nr:hypothetical protein [Akkermansiaceae bacterium]
MSIMVNDGQVIAPVEARDSQVTPQVGSQPESRLESNGPNGARTFLSAKRSGDIPGPHAAKAGGWKTPAPVIDLSAVASAKAEAEARETDKALKQILEKLGI